MDAYSDIEKQKIQLQDFLAKLNKEPEKSELQKTPDGKAFSLPISYVEMTLDELFFGMWSTENFKWSAIANEVQGSIELVVVHPITGKELRRTGSASIVITVDALSDQEKDAMSKQARNLYALNPENKKPNALDLSFPKLKAECTKNAAQSLGKIFGRDINRKHTDTFKPTLKPISENAFSTAISRITAGETDVIAKLESNFIMTELQKQILSNAISPKKLNGNTI